MASTRHRERVAWIGSVPSLVALAVVALVAASAVIRLGSGNESVAAASIAGIVVPDRVDADELRPGDCLYLGVPDPLVDRRDLVDRVPCDGIHDAEVVGRYQSSAIDPEERSDDDIRIAVTFACAADYGAYTGRPLDDPALQLVVLQGFRRSVAVCAVSQAGGGEVSSRLGIVPEPEQLPEVPVPVGTPEHLEPVELPDIPLVPIEDIEVIPLESLEVAAPTDP